MASPSRVLLSGLFALVLAAAGIAACGSSDRGYDGAAGGPGGPGGPGDLGGGPGVTSEDTLTVDPPEASLDVADGKPLPSTSFKAFVVKKDGTKLDVTAAAKFYVDDPPGASYGAFAGPTFTAAGTGVGKQIIHAKYQSLLGDATLKLRLTKTVVTTGAPPDAATKFGGAADASRKPAFVYPADGVMVPPNTNELEWHFQPGTGNDLFELAVKGSMIDLKVYLTCATKLGAGCAWTPDASVWGMLSGGGRGDDPLTVTLRGTTAAGGAGVGTSASQTIGFGEEDILGGLYYWNAGAGATMRYEFGVSGQKAETYMNAPKAGAAQCVGCHVLSRDGDRIALGLDIPGPAAFKVFDVATKTQVFGQGGAMGGTGANFFTFAPDKGQIALSNGVTMAIKDATTGAQVQDMGQGAMPDWSPDGATIVFAKSKTPPPCFGALCSATGVSEASLYTVTRSQGAWSQPGVLVAANGQNAYYPAFSPDGAWVLFNRASVGKTANNEEKTSYDAPDASLWLVKATGGNPVSLARAGSPNGDSWPKWMPKAQAWRGKKLMWMTFSSRRAYGLRQDAGKTAQIWMAAFDPEAAAQGKDGSFSAFRLPFQELASGNHIAQWVTRVARKGCTDAAACEGGEVCKDGACMPAVK